MYEFVGQGSVRRIEDVRRGVAAGFVRRRRKRERIGLDIERFDDEALLWAPTDGVERACGEFVLDAAAPFVERGGGER